jgi:hypothetical protein
MEEQREEIVKPGLTLVRNSNHSLSKVIILEDSYCYNKDIALYRRAEISGLTEQTPVVDFKLGGLEQVLPNLKDLIARVASAEEILLIREAVEKNISEKFQSRKYLFEDYLSLLHGNIPQSIKDKYGVK